jgi:hypothetical protein
MAKNKRMDDSPLVRHTSALLSNFFFFFIHRRAYGMSFRNMSGVAIFYKFFKLLKGLSRETDFKNFDKNLQNLTKLKDTAGV